MGEGGRDEEVFFLKKNNEVKTKVQNG